MAICSPCYTAYTDKRGFRAQHEFKMRVESLNAFTWLPFDLADQPQQYTLPGNEQPNNMIVGALKLVWKNYLNHSSLRQSPHLRACYLWGNHPNTVSGLVN